MAGLGGALWAYYLRYAAPSSWDVGLTIDLLTYVIVGGLGSVYGGAVGAAAVGWLQHWVQRDVPERVRRWGVVLPHHRERAAPHRVRPALPPGPGRPRQPRSAGRPAGRLAGAADAGGRGGAGHPPEAILEAEPELIAGTGTGPAADRQAPRGERGRASSSSTGCPGPSAASRRSTASTSASSPGRITAMVGPNGAGKSTFINLLSGASILPPAGEIRLGGVRIDGLPAADIARLGIARTFQTPRLFQGLTALETVMVARDRFATTGLPSAALQLPGVRRDEDEARRTARHWLRFVGLDAEGSTPALSLPVGHQRLAEVARALATEPDVLLLDEPAAGLDHTETTVLAEPPPPDQRRAASPCCWWSTTWRW